MTKRILPSQFNKVAQFGFPTSKKNGAGVNVPDYNYKLMLHYAPIKQTMTQQYLAISNNVTNTKTIAIRHNPTVNESMQVKLSDGEYSIESDSPDDSMGVNKYDYLTLKLVKKVGVS